MSTVTSTLALRVDDAGFAARLKADADAARNLNINSRDLAKLRATTGTAGLIRQYEKLGASVAQVGKYGDAQRGLQTLGAGFRSARVEVARTTAALAAAQKRKDFFDRSRANGSANFPAFEAAGLVKDADAALKKAARAHTAAKRSVENVARSYSETKATVRALGQELERAGHPVADLARVQTDLRAKMDATSSAIHRQARAHEEARVASVAASAETTRRANAALRATVAGAEASRRASQDAAALDAAAQRRQNRQAIRRAIQAGQEARQDRADAEAAETSRRVTAGRDMARGMGGAGRQQRDVIEGGRALTDGMSRPHREAEGAARARAEEEIAAGAARKEERRNGQKVLAGVAGVALGHRVKEGTKETLETYKEFDSERRFGQVVMGLTDEQQKPLVDQAIHMGATTRFNDVQVLEAQRELAARGLTRDQVLGMIPSAADLGAATDLKIPEAVKQIEGGIFGFKKKIGTVEEAAASARQTADVQVAAAKASGMTPDDIRQTYTYGATPARLAGVSEEKMLAFGAIGKKSNMDGAQMGTAWRALISNATAPTRKAKETMRANGLNYSDYQKAPEKLDLEAFSSNVASSYGVRLNDKAKERLGKVFTDKDLIKDASKFTPAVMDILGESLGKKEAKSKQSIAGMANRFRDASMQGVDVDRLIGDLLGKIPGNIAFSNALFGSKQGARIASAYGDPEAYKHILDALLQSAGKAGSVAEARNTGYAGASKRLEGSKKNLETSIGRSLDGDGEGKGGFLTGLTDAAAHATQSLAELPPSVVAAGAVFTWLGGKAASTLGTAALIGGATGIGTGIVAGKGSAMVAAATAGAAVAAPVVGAAILTAPLIAADKNKGLVHGGKDLANTDNFDLGLPGIDMESERKAKRSPSLPPGTAGMPQPAPARLPGLDGHKRPEAPAARRLPGFLTDEATLPPLPAMPKRGQRPAPVPAPEPAQEPAPAIATPAPVAPARPVSMPGAAPAAPVKTMTMPEITPKVDDSGITRLTEKAGVAKAELEKVSATNVAPQVSTGGLDGLIAKGREALSVLQAVASAAGSANVAIARVNAGALQGRSAGNRSFSDGVTPGAGAE